MSLKVVAGLAPAPRPPVGAAIAHLDPDQLSQAVGRQQSRPGIDVHAWELSDRDPLGSPVAVLAHQSPAPTSSSMRYAGGPTRLEGHAGQLGPAAPGGVERRARSAILAEWRREFPQATT
jgi:hypothetical protein